MTKKSRAAAKRYGIPHKEWKGDWVKTKTPSKSKKKKNVAEMDHILEGPKQGKFTKTRMR